MALADLIFAVYLGAAHTVSAPLSMTRPEAGLDLTLPNVTYRGESLSSPLYYGYRVTYIPGSHAWIGLEGEFTHLKVYANTSVPPLRGTVERFSMSHGLNLALANVAFRRTIRADSGGVPSVRLTARVGAGPTIPHVESTIGGISQEGYQGGALAVQAGVGFDISLSRHLNALAEYKLTRTHERVDIGGGAARGVFLSHHAIFGLSWHTR